MTEPILTVMSKRRNILVYDQQPPFSLGERERRPGVEESDTVITEEEIFDRSTNKRCEARTRGRKGVDARDNRSRPPVGTMITDAGRIYYCAQLQVKTVTLACALRE